MAASERGLLVRRIFQSATTMKENMMKKFIFGLIILTSLLPGVVEAKKKPQVVIPKRIATLPTTPLQTVALLAFVAPPLLVFYDLQRRTTCMNPPDPLGLGGPGFD